MILDTKLAIKLLVIICTVGISLNSYALDPTYSCPTGYGLSGTTCSKVTTYTATSTKTCPSPYYFKTSTSTMCAKSAGRCGKRTCWDYVDPIINYSCPSGGARSGSTCSLVSTVAATASCPVNYSLTGSECIENNNAPNAANSSVSTNEDASKVFPASFTDSDSGDTHTITNLTQPANGTVTVSGTNFTFTPEPDWYGTTSFLYRVKDNNDTKSGVATVTLTVTPVNDAPTVNSVSFNLPEDDNQTLTPIIADVDG